MVCVWETRMVADAFRDTGERTKCGCSITRLQIIEAMELLTTYPSPRAKEFTDAMALHGLNLDGFPVVKKIGERGRSEHPIFGLAMLADDGVYQRRRHHNIA